MEIITPAYNIWKNIALEAEERVRQLEQELVERKKDFEYSETILSDIKITTCYRKVRELPRKIKRKIYHHQLKSFPVRAIANEKLEVFKVVWDGKETIHFVYGPNNYFIYGKLVVLLGHEEIVILENGEEKARHFTG